MALYALGSSVSVAFPVWTPSFKTSNRGNTVPRGAEERELCIDSKRCYQQRPAFCPDTWPHYFRVMWREPSWRLFWGPAVFHMTSHTHITFLSLNIKAAIFLCRCLPRKLSDIASSLAPWWHQSHVGLTGKEQLWLFKVSLCHRGRANVNSWVMGLMAMVGSVVLIVVSCMWARVTEDHHHHHHHQSEGYLGMSTSKRWWRSFVKSLRWHNLVPSLNFQSAAVSLQTVYSLILKDKNSGSLTFQWCLVSSNDRLFSLCRSRAAAFKGRQSSHDVPSQQKMLHFPKAMAGSTQSWDRLMNSHYALRFCWLSFVQPACEHGASCPLAEKESHICTLFIIPRKW